MLSEQLHTCIESRALGPRPLQVLRCCLFRNAVTPAFCDGSPFFHHRGVPTTAGTTMPLSLHAVDEHAQHVVLYMATCPIVTVQCMVCFHSSTASCLIYNVP